ncbi:MAG: DUF354 domain-containing protein [Paludibacter sp.]|nr:DUF354 domain-containing protein [Paludibacter sp.]
MNILIYVGHPAQYHFFKNAISILKDQGHKIVLLMKTKDVLEELIQEDGHDYINIQPKSRKNNPISIFIASVIRTYKVVKLVKKHHINILLGTDASIAQAGFLTKKHAITALEDDYDVISKLAKLTYPYTSSILVPSVCSVGKWELKKVAYEGYMKLAYLHPNRFLPNITIKKKYISEDKYCILRLAGLTAYHDAGKKGLNITLVNEIIKNITDKGFRVYISAEEELDERFAGYQLQIKHKDIHHVLSYASLLISDSQSMSVEAAMLGVPSIRFSDFTGRISVLEELEQKYHLTFGVRTCDPEKLLRLTDEILSDPKSAKLFQSNRSRMLVDKIDVTAFLVWFIENYPDSVTIIKKTSWFQLKFK